MFRCCGEISDSSAEVITHSCVCFSQAVYDLAWELMQEIYAEDPNTNRPLWIKPQRVNSPYIHRIDDPSDLSKVQVCVCVWWGGSAYILFCF